MSCQTECLHFVSQREEDDRLRCCECGTHFNSIHEAIIQCGDDVMYRLNVDHIPPGPYWPSIAYLNRRV